MAENDITSSTETERKYDVPEDAPAPELDGFLVLLPEHPDLLEAVYYDTEDGALAAERMVLRRRTGGHDAGWHLKTPGEGGRTEHHAELADAPPAGLLDIVKDILGDRPLIPTAEIRTERTPILLLDDEGRAVAEIADDRVAGTDVREGVVRTWREWEAELLEEAPQAPAKRVALLDRIEAQLVAQGATPSPSMSKFARATGRAGLGPSEG
ncbi:CYTH domain-containing protein [Naasia aerilata]|uniref:CYTH domain-containing protein n=1 Tax=Naasia aerilata TaxID=1162966 RepID=A0ABM8GCI0_9MICO|nr:CYTH domain-containing protein [Naasia aerilata]BDZ45957.1 hypothetical protein GCM10025866_18660 [Naasia aerilata]